MLDATTVFALRGTQPNTFGNFVTVVNPSPEMEIDMLRIELSNTSAPCCANPMGLDNIVVRITP